jgi:hypothetical protein
MLVKRQFNNILKIKGSSSQRPLRGSPGFPTIKLKSKLRKKKRKYDYYFSSLTLYQKYVLFDRKLWKTTEKFDKFCMYPNIII